MAIKSIIESVIRKGGLPLSQIAERVDEMYAAGRLSAAERAELTDLMHAQAKPDHEKTDPDKRLDVLAVALSALERRVEALERGGAGESAPSDEVSAWRPWDGVSDRYQHGDVVTHGGKTWQSVYNGHNVWEPGAVGIDSRYWVEVE